MKWFALERSSNISHPNYHMVYSNPGSISPGVALSAVVTLAKTGARFSQKVISAIAETTWRQQKAAKLLLAPTKFDPCLSRFGGSCRLISVACFETRANNALVT